jgi:hypothetical protein
MYQFLLNFLKAASVVTDELLKVADNHRNGFLKATGNFLKTSAYNFQLSLQNSLIWELAVFGNSFVTALATF